MRRASSSGDQLRAQLCFGGELNASLREVKLDRRIPDSLQLAREQFSCASVDADNDDDLASATTWCSEGGASRSPASTWCSEGGAARGSFSTIKVTVDNTCHSA
jgi:hypothetical protein